MPVWNKLRNQLWDRLWNAMRIEWVEHFGRNRHHVERVLYDLRIALRQTGVSCPPLTEKEEALVIAIKNRTREANLNNLTRTTAYLEYYKHNSEVHWALLAHFVSRNGGYGMTDIQGEWFTRIANSNQKQSFFAFLERANWLIFQDAFPQLLLYEEGKKEGRNLSYLLPEFSISRFMGPIWNLFWEHRDSSLLTRALIINEQNYIESRVVKNPVHELAVEQSIQFQVQSLLNLNLVLLPFRQGADVRLAGTTVEQFTSVDDRIETGLRLYRALFGDRLHSRRFYTFACEAAHNASRTDYWPQIFTSKRPLTIGNSYQPHFVGTKSLAYKIYSPRLADVWPDVEHKPAEAGDWFQNLGHAIYLFGNIPQQPPDITEQYIASLKTIESLVIAKEKVQAVLPG